MSFSTITKSFVAFLVIALCSSVATAKTLRYATGHPPQSDGHLSAEIYAQAVERETNGELKVRVFPMSLLSYGETPSGVRDGLADIGMVLGPYFPQEYPSMNFAAEATMLLNIEGIGSPRDSYVYTGVMLEYIFLHCEECHREFDRQNQVFTSVGSSSRYILMCTEEISSVDDFRGARMRSAGPMWSRWIAGMGATDISMPGNEMREALGQGVIDCASTSLPELQNLGLMEVVSHLMPELPGGVFAGAAVGQVNKDTWNSLTDAQRLALYKAGSVYAAESSFMYNQSAVEALDEAVRQGKKIVEPDESLINASNRFIEEDMNSLAQFYENRFGFENTAGNLERIRDLIRKWDGLIGDNVESAEELADIYWDQVYSRVLAGN